MSQHYAITMPQLSDTMTEGVVVTWEKQAGDKVERGDMSPRSRRQASWTSKCSRPLSGRAAG